MNTLLAGVGVLLLAGTAFAEDLHDHGRHRPSGVELEGHTHAHPGVDFAHPIITESPLPETHLRLDYNFAGSGDGREHTLTASGEYAFTPNFSVEAALPYTLLDPDDAGTAGRLGDATVGVKLATYQFVEHGLLPAVGLEINLPTGNEERGIGSDHVVELEPFVRAGYRAGPLELIGSLAVGIPLNQEDDESDDEDFALAYNVSTLYHVTPDVQALLELHGESVFGGADESVFSLSPGVTFQPFADKSVTIGLGVTVPVTDDKPFDYAINFMTIVHF
jgi:hypothetical protein